MNFELDVLENVEAPSSGLSDFGHGVVTGLALVGAYTILLT